jgi:cytochrome c oxidase assembly protein subunit 15
MVSQSQLTEECPSATPEIYPDLTMRLSPSRYRQITMGALVALSVIVVSGAAVRLTGSGLGCDDWPNCNSERLIDVSTTHAAIEQINRLFTGVVAIAVIAAVLGSLFRAPRRRDLTLLSIGLVLGVIGQVILGAITVWVKLHPIAVQGHFLLSMVLLANAVVLLRRAGEPDGQPRRVAVDPLANKVIWLVTVLTTVAIVTGTVVTGTGPHAGDEVSPRFDFEIQHVARIHGISVIATIATTLWLVALMRKSPVLMARLRHGVSSWMLLAVLQAVLGYVQYLSGVPALLVGMHVLGATLLFIATMHLLFDRITTDVAQFAEPEPVGATH